MARSCLPLAQLVHEHLSVIMCFAFSRRPLSCIVDARFKGNWPYLNKALFEISSERAARACFELAVFLRTLDDDDAISQYHRTTGQVQDCGLLHLKTGSSEKAHFPGSREQNYSCRSLRLGLRVGRAEIDLHRARRREMDQGRSRSSRTDCCPRNNNQLREHLTNRWSLSQVRRRSTSCSTFMYFSLDP